MKLSLKPFASICFLGSILSIHAANPLDDTTAVRRRVQRNGKPRPESGQNCNVSANISCKVTGTNTDCDKIGVQPPGTCGAKMLTMRYEYCNEMAGEPVRKNVTPLLKNPDGEFGTIAMYRQKWGEPNFNPLPTGLEPGKCEVRTVTREVDTCKRRIVAEIKLEGWVQGHVDEDEYYCYAWKFLQADFDQAIVPVVPVVPVVPPAPTITVIINCMCQRDNSEYQCGSPSFLDLSFNTCDVKVNYSYTVINSSNTNARLDALLNENLVNLLGDSVVIGARSEEVFLVQETINICRAGGSLIEKKVLAIAGRVTGGVISEARNTFNFRAPLFPLDLSMESIMCEIDDGTYMDCNQYVQEITSISQCEVDIRFKYAFKKTSDLCLDIQKVTAAPGPLGNTLVAFEDEISCQNRLICGRNQFTISDRRASVNLCTMTQDNYSRWTIDVDVYDIHDRKVEIDYTYTWATLATLPSPLPAPAPTPDRDILLPVPVPVTNPGPSPGSGSGSVGVECSNHPKKIKFEINPTDCEDSRNGLKLIRALKRSNNGKNGKNGKNKKTYFSCVGEKPTNYPVTVTFTTKYGTNANVIKIADSSVTGSTPWSKIPANVMVKITDGTNTQQISFHSSCSKPIYTGDTFGSFMINDFEY